MDIEGDCVFEFPVVLEGFKFRESRGDWVVTFSLENNDLEKMKPVQNFMGKGFKMELSRFDENRQIDTEEMSGIFKINQAEFDKLPDIV